MRRLGQQLIGLGHERLGDFAGKMSLAARFVLKRVEDAEACRAQFDGIPGVVAGSAAASGCADLRNASSSFSLPGLASSRASIANLSMLISVWFLLTIG